MESSSHRVFVSFNQNPLSSKITLVMTIDEYMAKVPGAGA